MSLLVRLGSSDVARHPWTKGCAAVSGYKQHCRSIFCQVCLCALSGDLGQILGVSPTFGRCLPRCPAWIGYRSHARVFLALDRRPPAEPCVLDLAIIAGWIVE